MPHHCVVIGVIITKVGENVAPVLIEEVRRDHRLYMG